MSDVTCSRCWLWQPLGRSTTCRACGAPLITAMGGRVDQAWAPAAGDPAAVAAGYPPAGGWAPPSYVRMTGAETASGTDWVLWVRVVLAVPSLLLAAMLMILGLLLQHVTLPAAAGQVPQTVDIGPVVVVLVVMILAITALIVWLARFAVVRAILLILVAVNVVSVLIQIAGAIPVDRIAMLVDVGWDIGYAALLILSLTSPRPQPR
jgi:hypothetical protein